MGHVLIYFLSFKVTRITGYKNTLLYTCVKIPQVYVHPGNNCFQKCKLVSRGLISFHFPFFKECKTVLIFHRKETTMTEDNVKINVSNNM